MDFWSRTSYSFTFTVLAQNRHDLCTTLHHSSMSYACSHSFVCWSFMRSYFCLVSWFVSANILKQNSSIQLFNLTLHTFACTQIWKTRTITSVYSISISTKDIKSCTACAAILPFYYFGEVSWSWVLSLTD